MTDPVLTRRDDELTMEDEREPLELEVPAVVRSHDELPRDASGRVIGVWHVAGAPEDYAYDPDDRVFDAADHLEGDLVDRAISLGCALRPGPFESALAELEAGTVDDPEAYARSLAEGKIAEV